MADLNVRERRQFERLLKMGGGYVLEFSNRTLSEFVADSAGRTNPSDAAASSGASDPP